MTFRKEWLDIAIALATEVIPLVIDAFQKKDPTQLKKVTDILPRDHVLRSRAALALEEEITRGS